MPTFYFLGKILPSNAYKVNMWDLPTMAYQGSDTGLAIEISIKVENSEIEVKCTTKNWDDDIRTQVHKVAYDFARATVNMFCFASGINLEVLFDEVIDVDGIKKAFLNQDPSLAPLCTAYQLISAEKPTSFSVVMNLVLSEPALFLALDDVITATSKHNSITVNCARAIEALRHAISPTGASRGKAWELFRKNLRIQKEYLDLITDTSKSSRHGEGVFIPGNITTEIVRRTRTVMNRFIEFRKGKNQPLNEADFPMLDK